MGVDEKKLREYFSEAPSDISLADIDMARIPGHVSIIMDGNGRWAKGQYDDIDLDDLGTH